VTVATVCRVDRETVEAPAPAVPADDQGANDLAVGGLGDDRASGSRSSRAPTSSGNSVGEAEASARRQSSSTPSTSPARPGRIGGVGTAFKTRESRRADSNRGPLHYE
jgi:hypothetical protein